MLEVAASQGKVVKEAERIASTTGTGTRSDGLPVGENQTKHDVAIDGEGTEIVRPAQCETERNRAWD